MEERPKLPKVTPEYLVILVVREFRKVGFDVSDVRIHRRSELAEPERGFVLELVALLARGDWRRRALVACRRQDAPVGRGLVESVKERLDEAHADVGLVFSTADFAPEALTAAHQHGVALLRIVDGRTAFEMGGWGPPDHYPPWLPAYLVQLVECDPAGLVRSALLEPGRSDLILHQLQPAPAAPPVDRGATGGEAGGEGLRTEDERR